MPTSTPGLAFAPGYNAGGFAAERDDPFAPPYEGKPPGYVRGEGVGYVRDAGKEDPFDERDVTSRPGIGGDETFAGRRG